MTDLVHTFKKCINAIALKDDLTHPKKTNQPIHTCVV